MPIIKKVIKPNSIIYTDGFRAYENLLNEGFKAHFIVNHGNNEFGFSEFTTKRERITEAIKIAVKNDFLNVEKSEDGFLYSISERGREVVRALESPYARDYTVGAKIVCNRFSSFSDEGILKYISDLSTEAKEG